MSTVDKTAADPRGTARRSLLRGQRRAGLLFALPGTLHIGLWIGLPVVAAFVLSLTDYDVFTTPQFVGLDNYAEIFGDDGFLRSLWTTLLYAVGTVPVTMAISLGLAVLLNQGMRGQAFFRTAIYLPQITATVAVALIWSYILQVDGLANEILGSVGIGPVAWLNDPSVALVSVILISIWQGLGFNTLIYLAALQGVPGDLYEAAAIDGAGPWRKFLDITVPLLRPATYFVLITATVGAFQAFDQVYVLTRGGPAYATTLTTYEIYNTGFSDFRLGVACAQSVVLLVALIVLTAVNTRTMGESRDGH
ncbi:carbohydrate ABC transporter permease [Streptomyces sp. NPDC060194]|uniref:carbohydrate ABC transporter permease n=1 Tax=Streptomyces sp. NPDC060194 TaxID=3347069 RepID=UPI003646F41B